MRFFLLLFFVPSFADAKLNVVATIPDLAAVAREVGGDDVAVESIAKGTQDPHFIEAKPSYMVKVSKADLVVAVGLELEVGWLPSLLSGARNPRVAAGGKGYFELGPSLDPLDVPTGKLTRADGDVHPDGNPHFYLDPIRIAKAAELLGERLGELDGEHAAGYSKRAKAFADRLRKRTEDWAQRVKKSGVTKVVTYHKTLTYFFARFGLENPAILEPKPGIPPTSAHIIEVIQLMKTSRVKLVLVENFFDSSVTKKLLPEVPGARAEEVAVDVEGAEGIRTNEDLIEQLVRKVEGK